MSKEKYQKRNSSIELYRIILMIIIVAHHYVVNSGVQEVIKESNNIFSFNSIFALIFGWGGKTAIDGFILITGYFMVNSNISLKKFLKLIFEILFYNIIITTIFIVTGYSEISIKEIIKNVIPLYTLGTAFIPSYLVFFLFIPFINILISNMNEKDHLLLLLLCFIVNSLIQTFAYVPNAFTYVGLFIFLYLISAYVRKYDKSIFNKKKIWKYATVVCLVVSWLSVVLGAYIYDKTNKDLMYYFVADSNKVMCIFTAFTSFMYFKNIKMNYHPIINKIASAVFGVLLIHANSDWMRQWLWKDIFKNTTIFNSSCLVVHAIFSVVIIYIVCTIIELIRIEILEKRTFKLYDKLDIENKFKKLLNKICNKLLIEG